MEDCKSIITEEGDERAIASAQNTAKTVETAANLTDDMIRILSVLENQFPTATALSENKRSSEVEERLDFVQEKITSWDSDQSMIWDCDPAEASEYLRAVGELCQLTENLGKSSSFNQDRKENVLLNRAHSVLQMAMARLEEEFVHILVENRQSLEPQHLSFRSIEEDVADEDLSSLSLVNEDPAEDTQVKLKGDNSRVSEELEFIIDLVHPEVIPDLKCIAELMFTSEYDRECCQAYCSVRKDALDECLFILEVEKLSIEEIFRTDWSILNSKIKKWIRAMKIFVRVYLASEKQLCDQIFGQFGSVSRVCFVEASKGSILQLLNFGEAIAIGPHLSEKLFRILDMYEGLADLVPDIESLFSEEDGSCVRTECHEVLNRLGESVRGTFDHFENAIRTSTSTTPVAGGGIHPLTKYVMNYLQTLTDYSDTLNLILEGNDEDRHLRLLSNTNTTVNEEDGIGSSCSVSPMACRLQSVVLTLEANLDSKSNLYRDSSLQHFFLLNNIYYMVQKVKDSELRAHFGGNWIRRHNRKFRQQAVNYERASWNLILSFLKDEGICNPGSNTGSKAVLKDRFRSFNLAFEEIYKTQTGWLIPDPQLRDDLRISISLRVLQAYRTFMGRYSSQLEGGRHGDKSIKYSAEDLQDYLLDLFEGSPKSLHNPRRR